MPLVRPLNRIEHRIATMLTAQDFETLVCELIRSKQGNLATRYVEERAAAYFGGSTRSRTHTYDTPNDFGYRRFDINGPDRLFELKFRGNPISAWEVRKDVWFRSPSSTNLSPRVNLWYLFIDGPSGERPSREDFTRLGSDIPYIHWTWRRFLQLT